MSLTLTTFLMWAISRERTPLIHFFECAEVGPVVQSIVNPISARYVYADYFINTLLFLLAKMCESFAFSHFFNKNTTAYF